MSSSFMRAPAGLPSGRADRTSKDMMAITIDGDVRVIRRLDQAIAAVGNCRTAMEEIAETMDKEVRGNFTEEGARLEPSRWTALTPSTILDRLRKGFAAGPILVRTGDLRDSFMADVGDMSVRFFSTCEYFQYHQLGGPNLPRRRMLAFSERLKQEILAAFRRFVHDSLETSKLPYYPKGPSV